MASSWMSRPWGGGISFLRAGVRVGVRGRGKVRARALLQSSRPR